MCVMLFWEYWLTIETHQIPLSSSITTRQLPTKRALSLTQVSSTHFPIISLHILSSHHHQQLRRCQAKIHFDQLLRGFEVVQRRRTFMPLPSSRILRLQKRGDFPLHQVVHAILMKAQDQIATVSMTMVKRELDAPIRIVVGHLKISKRTCSLISRNDLRSVQSSIARITTKALLGSMIKIGTH